MAPSDPNVIYVGGGEKTLRGNVSPGWGMWKSDNAGRSWTSLGFEEAQHIPRVVVHPRDEDVVYAAVLGHAFGPNEERGVYRSTDGGETWSKVLYVSEDVGAYELEMDPTNPRVLYASLWRVRRTPYSFSSGGEGSSIWRSTDGGDTWEDISASEGLPEGTWGVSAVSIAPSDPDRRLRPHRERGRRPVPLRRRRRDVAARLHRPESEAARVVLHPARRGLARTRTRCGSSTSSSG